MYLPPCLQATKNVTYKQMYDAIKKYCAWVCIIITHITHAMRCAGALFLDDAGVDDSVIARHGHWAMASMYKNYLQWFKAKGLYALGGWWGAAAKDFQQFWDPRFLVPVPVELVDLVMPFLTTLRNQVASLGDRAEASHRWGLF